MGKKLIYMIKYGLLFFFFITASTLINAQALEDVIYLKNQDIIRGTILKKNDSVYTIQTGDGSIYNYRAHEVEKINREKLYRNFSYKQSGYSNFTEIGALVAGKTTQQGVTTAAFSFQSVNGYKF